MPGIAVLVGFGAMLFVCSPIILYFLIRPRKQKGWGWGRWWGTSRGGRNWATATGARVIAGPMKDSGAPGYIVQYTWDGQNWYNWTDFEDEGSAIYLVETLKNDWANMKLAERSTGSVLMESHKDEVDPDDCAPWVEGLQPRIKWGKKAIFHYP